jgi:hypothetical protein
LKIVAEDRFALGQHIRRGRNFLARNHAVSCHPMGGVSKLSLG